VVHTKLLTTPILLQHKSGQGRSYIWGTCFHDCCLNQSINQSYFQRDLQATNICCNDHRVHV